jgi:hypothetical protein
MRGKAGLILLIALTGGARAEYDGEALAGLCRDHREFVQGYVMGILDKGVDDSYIVSTAPLVGRFVTKEDVKAAKDNNHRDGRSQQRLLYA